MPSWLRRNHRVLHTMPPEADHHGDVLLQPSYQSACCIQCRGVALGDDDDGLGDVEVGADDAGASRMRQLCREPPLHPAC